MKNGMFEGIVPEMAVDITALYTIHYFEYYQDYFFKGEAHDFWEFIYADRGAIHVQAGEEKFTLRQGQLLFHPPGQFHTVATSPGSAANAIVISFSCESEALNALAGHVMSVTQLERQLLSDIVTEARAAFSNNPGDAGYTALIRSGSGDFAAEQYIMSMLAMLIIRLIRRTGRKEQNASDTRPASLEYFLIAAEYIARNLDAALSLDDISAAAGVSPAHMERLCNRATGMSVIQYCRARRMERAKELLREGMLTITAVANATGFSSVHYFSRTFKSVVGMSPREYVRSVRSMADRPAAGTYQDIYTPEE